eukprot:5014396-Alexandrium_andersonii.AAC.1
MGRVQDALRASKGANSRFVAGEQNDTKSFALRHTDDGQTRASHNSLLSGSLPAFSRRAGPRATAPRRKENDKHRACGVNWLEFHPD